VKRSKFTRYRRRARSLISSTGRNPRQNGEREEECQRAEGVATREVWDPQEGFCRKRIATLGLIKCIRRPTIECCNVTSSTQALFSI
jgi:hypothetical protein